MKKFIVLCLALVIAISMAGCAKEDTVQFHDKTFKKTDLSQETVEWLAWYNDLPEEEQLSVSSIPSDLYELCGYSPAEAVNAAVED